MRARFGGPGTLSLEYEPKAVSFCQIHVQGGLVSVVWRADEMGRGVLNRSRELSCLLVIETGQQGR